MKLDPVVHQYIAQRAQWYFDVSLHSSDDRGDSAVLIGDGLEDLNSTVAFIQRYPRCTVVCDAGFGPTVLASAGIPAGASLPSYQPCDVDDVYAIKDAYIAFYGSVTRPAHTDPSGSTRRLL